MSDEKPVMFELRVNAAEYDEVIQALEERRDFYRKVIESLDPSKDGARRKEYEARHKLVGMLQVKCENQRHDRVVQLRAERDAATKADS